MRRYNILAYGESNEAFAPGFMQMGSAVTNNLAELDRRRAANENSRLELTRINLELTKTQLELYLSRDSQLIANTAAACSPVVRLACHTASSAQGKPGKGRVGPHTFCYESWCHIGSDGILHNVHYP